MVQMGPCCQVQSLLMLWLLEVDVVVHLGAEEEEEEEGGAEEEVEEVFCMFLIILLS